ncbi:MAG: nucleoside triphosphate pyrophosphohydrolase [Candidatus Nomurabacteria bacterium]|jgi:predicted house-cleaning noncanonical NTP pyrophosphatase (MazG superfamily)|nr:nucleoside triphosphate pyrophosphohydrolase [Candidatus Nomurabacteria bacterium]
MTKFYYGKKGKLVRDKIPATHTADGHKLGVRRIDRAELASAILGKVPEELAELTAAYKMGDEKAEKKEIVDLKTLIDAYIAARGFNPADIEAVAQQKITTRGGFAEGYWIDWIDLKDNSADGQRLLKKFRREPEKYVEEGNEN